MGFPRSFADVRMERILAELFDAFGPQPVYRLIGLQPLSNLCTYRVKLAALFQLPNDIPLLEPSVIASFRRLVSNDDPSEMEPPSSRATNVTIEPGRVRHDEIKIKVMSISSSWGSVNFQMTPMTNVFQRLGPAWQLVLEFPQGIVSATPSNDSF